MIYQLSKILEDVRVCLDRNQTDTALISDGDEETLQLDELIQSKVLEGVRRVHSEAPYWMLEASIASNVSLVFDTQDTCGHIILPSNFMRLVLFQMSDWRYPVHEALTVTDPDYAKQRSSVKGVRGTYDRPVCALTLQVAKDAPVKVLEFYSCKANTATIKQLLYMPKPTISNNTAIDISEQCYDAVVYTIAGLTLVSCGEAEKAKVMFDIAQGLMG